VSHLEAGCALQTSLSCTCAAQRLPASPAAPAVPSPNSTCRSLHRRTLPLPSLPAAFVTPNKHRCHYIIQDYLLPSLNSAPPSPPRRHTTASSTPAVHAAAPAIVLASDRLRLTPPPWSRNHGRSSRGQSHDVEVHTVGRPRKSPVAPVAAYLAQVACNCLCCRTALGLLLQRY
jgi:hypothetical protein